MTPRRQRNENANAEILGVVILIGIFAVTAGIISATVLATPEAEKVPAASIEITGSPGRSASPTSAEIRCRPNSLVRGTRVRRHDTRNTRRLDAWLAVYRASPSATASAKWPRRGWVALVLIWNGRRRGVGDRELGPDRHLRPARPVRASGGNVPVAQPAGHPARLADADRRPGTPRSRMSRPTSRRRIDGRRYGVGDSTFTDTLDRERHNRCTGLELRRREDLDDARTRTTPTATTGTYTVTLTVSNTSTGASTTRPCAKPGCVQVTGSDPPVDLRLHRDAAAA